MAERPILYSFRRCPYAMRARIALLVSGIVCEIREVKLSAKPEEMIAVSPKGTVPVLVLSDGTVIDQSIDIMRWALDGAVFLEKVVPVSAGLPHPNPSPEGEGLANGERYPTKAPPLQGRGWGGEPVAIETLHLVDANDGPFKQHLDRYKYPDRHDDDPMAHRDAAMTILWEYEARLQRHPHLLGDRPSIADIAILPFVRQFAAVDQAWFDAQPLPGVQHWLGAFVASPLFEQAMVRLSPWRPGDAPIEFGRPTSFPSC